MNKGRGVREGERKGMRERGEGGEEKVKGSGGRER